MAVSEIDKKRTLLLQEFETQATKFLIENIEATTQKGNAFGENAEVEFKNKNFKTNLLLKIRVQTSDWLVPKAIRKLYKENPNGKRLEGLKLLEGWFNDDTDATGLLKAVADRIWQKIKTNVKETITNPAALIVTHPEIAELEIIQKEILKRRNKWNIEKWENLGFEGN